MFLSVVQTNEQLWFKSFLASAIKPTWTEDVLPAIATFQPVHGGVTYCMQYINIVWAQICNSTCGKHLKSCFYLMMRYSIKRFLCYSKVVWRTFFLHPYRQVPTSYTPITNLLSITLVKVIDPNKDCCCRVVASKKSHRKRIMPLLDPLWLLCRFCYLKMKIMILIIMA